jgi:hypothetical protein
MTTELRPAAAGSAWQLAAALAALFAATRVVGVLGPNSLRWLLPLGFTLMALTPFLLLDAAGRRGSLRMLCARLRTVRREPRQLVRDHCPQLLPDDRYHELVRCAVAPVLHAAGHDLQPDR